MQQDLSQLPLAVRIPTLKEAVLTARGKKEQAQQDEDAMLDLLAQAEAQVTGKAPGWEDVELSGLIPEGENPYQPHSDAPTTKKASKG